jgi:uncharacterized protein
MSETYKKIKSEIIVAMKAKDAPRLVALRGLDSAIKNAAIENGHRDGPTEEDALKALAQLIKRGSDSFEQFTNGSREDLAIIEKEQVAIFKSFLPEQIDRSELKLAVSEIIQDYSATNGIPTQKDFGKLMKIISEKFKGQTDNKTISELIKEVLANGT